MSQLPDDLIPPDCPVRAFGRIYCNKECARAAGVLTRDMEIVTYAERHEYLNLPNVPKFMGFCAQCGAII